MGKPLRKLNTRTWYAHWSQNTKSFYVRSSITKNGKRIRIFLHRFIMDAPEDLYVDHINHNTLDNRRSKNLRLVSASENQYNRKNAQSNSKSGILGVSWDKHKKRWRAVIHKNKRAIYNRYFKNLDEAVEALTLERKKLATLSYKKVINA